MDLFIQYSHEVLIPRQIKVMQLDEYGPAVQYHLPVKSSDARQLLKLLML